MDKPTTVVLEQGEEELLGLGACQSEVVPSICNCCAKLAAQQLGRTHFMVGREPVNKPALASLLSSHESRRCTKVE